MAEKTAYLSKLGRFAPMFIVFEYNLKLINPKGGYK